jgi:hypothetical protein
MLDLLSPNRMCYSKQPLPWCCTSLLYNRPYPPSFSQRPFTYEQFTRYGDWSHSCNNQSARLIDFATFAQFICESLIADVLDVVMWATCIQTSQERVEWQTTYNATIDFGTAIVNYTDLSFLYWTRIHPRPDIGQIDTDSPFRVPISYYFPTTMVIPPSPQ